MEAHRASLPLSPAAVNYAMTRTFPATPSYHLFYDLGASSLRTTLVSLKSAMLPDPYSLAAKPELKNVTSVTVHGFGFDVDVGGYQLDRIVRDIMVEEVEKKGNSVKGDRRAMAKLLKEASRVKQVLSANTASAARVSTKIRRPPSSARNQIELISNLSTPRLRASSRTLISAPRLLASNSSLAPPTFSPASLSPSTTLSPRPS